jgi:polyisoprenoid-binding protein YceI
MTPAHRRRARARRLAAGVVLAAACVGATAQAQRWRLLPDHTWVTFEVLHFGVSTVRGRIGPVQGEITLDATAQRGDLGLVIDTRRVDTGLKVFDSRIAAPDLLDSAAQPQAFFVASGFRFDGDRVAEVRGEFTLRGVPQPLTLRALRFGCRVDASQARICGGDFEGEVLRSAHGITFGLPFVADRVRLLVQIEAVALP